MISIDLGTLYGKTAKIGKLDEYLGHVGNLPLDGRDVVLTGNAPIWLYLKVAHALHGRAKRLYYEAPAMQNAGRLLIFDHDPL